jgi:CDP-diacylglycerol--serine O-phosphatidyltransferase
MVLGTVYGLSYLMVSSVKYQSFKHAQTDRAQKFQFLVGLVVLIMVLAAEPRVTLFILMAAYVLSGPLTIGYHLVMRRRSGIVEEQDKSI